MQIFRQLFAGFRAMTGSMAVQAEQIGEAEGQRIAESLNRGLQRGIAMGIQKSLSSMEGGTLALMDSSQFDPNVIDITSPAEEPVEESALKPKRVVSKSARKK